MNLIILRFIHYCIALSTFMKQWIFRLLSLSFISKTNISAIQADARNLKKLPLHLGMIFLEDDISYSGIANAILWSVAMGISFISIYDANGVVKRNEKTLYEEINKRKGTDLDSEQCKADIQLHSSLQKRPERKPSYGLSCFEDLDRGSSQVDVFLLSSDEGRKSIVEVAKNISQQVIEKQIKSSEITPQFIDLYFQGETGYPDPDLVIKFGLTESLMGFMPWHVRLTEILIQDVCIMFSAIVIFLLFFNTYIFQAGLVNILVSKFKIPISVVFVYFCLCVGLHVWYMTLRWTDPDAYIWDNNGIRALFIIQRTAAVFHYYFYKRTCLKLGDPRFYQESDWIKKEFEKRR